MTIIRERRACVPMPARVLLLPLVVIALPITAGGESNPDEPVVSPRVLRRMDVAPVWSGHPVGFDLITRNGRQYVAFYDAERRMTIAARSLDSDTWQFTRLPSELGWDSHNSVVLAIDDLGYLHVSGNMHVHPLVYFRSVKPWESSAFEAIHRMVGDLEDRCTYPKFFRGPGGVLIFTYRHGKSGDGNQIFNVYNAESRRWRRLLDRPLTDGEGIRNAYFQGPSPGPDRYYHLAWVWRETPDCATNHDLSYARSRDLVHWETASGRPIELPLRLDRATIVDPVPEGAGLINVGFRLGWDSAGRIVLAYHKYDENGLTQAHVARFEDDAWTIRRVSDWSYRWEFGGGGSIPVEVGIGPIEAAGPGQLAIGYSHVKHGSGRIVLDEVSLAPVAVLPPERSLPVELGRRESTFPGMQVRTKIEPGRGSVRYVLRWETLGPNRDRPRTGPLPEPSMLRLYEIQTSGGRDDSETDADADN